MRSFPLRALALLLPLCACSRAPQDGTYTFDLLTTNDIHGCWFDSTYVGSGIKPSLMAVQACVDSIRRAAGPENVILVDAGDCLQGDNAAYYFNYVDTVTPHLFPRLVSYMHYDALAWGNHDVETGHPVYDRVYRDLQAAGIPLLAGNAIRNDNGKPYFPAATLLRRQGVRIAILGYENPNIKAWLDESLWSGMHFESLIPRVQEDVDAIQRREKPHVVIVAVHSGTGKGDGSSYESQGLDLLESLQGVDFLVCSHDHSARIVSRDDICLINSGSHARNLGHGRITLTLKKGKVTGKTLSAELIPVDPSRVDAQMRQTFRADFEAVKAFTCREVGNNPIDMDTRDAFRGMSPYMNLIHTLALSCAPARISLAAPLTYNGHIAAGTLIYNDLFTLYPFENQLFILKMTGQEIKDYLEYSYDNWVETLPGPHALRIRQRDDDRYAQRGWSFVNRSYNFDSAAGIHYTVDLTKPDGERITILSMAGGTPFSLTETYPVAMTSYRANGGGDLLEKGAGIDPDRIEERIVGRYPEMRNLLYQYLVENGTIDPAVTGDPERIGSWAFIPQPLAGKQIDADMRLLFGR